MNQIQMSLDAIKDNLRVAEEALSKGQTGRAQMHLASIAERANQCSRTISGSQSTTGGQG